MDIRVLRYYLVVAEEENITKAAQILNMTQPTLSRQLIQLEEELDTQLFVRKNHSITLTKEGILFRRRAQEIVNLLEKSKKEIAQSDDLKGEITIGCNESQSMKELSSMIHYFRERYPRVMIKLRTGDSLDIRSWIDQGEVDFGLLLEPIDMKKYHYFRMKEKEQWGFLVKNDTELAKQVGITSKELLDIPIIPPMDQVLYTELTNWAGKYAQLYSPLAYYNLISSAALLVERGEGIAVCIKPYYDFSNLTFVPLLPPLEVSSFLVWKSNGKLSEVNKRFIIEIQEYKKCMSADTK